MSADIIIGSQVLVRYVRKSFHMSQVAHQAGAYPSFSSMKQLGEFLLPLDKMLVHRRVTPSIKFASTHLYPLVEKGTVRVKYLEPGPPALELSALTIRPPRLSLTVSNGQLIDQYVTDAGLILD